MTGASEKVQIPLPANTMRVAVYVVQQVTKIIVGDERIDINAAIDSNFAIDMSVAGCNPVIYENIENNIRKLDLFVGFVPGGGPNVALAIVDYLTDN